MELHNQIRVWQDFLSEYGTSKSGLLDYTDEMDETDYEKEIIQIIQKIQLIHKSTLLYTSFLSSRNSLPKRTLAIYCIHGDLTDTELARLLGFSNDKAGANQAGNTRRKDSIAENIEGKTTEKPIKYGLTSKARVKEEEYLKQWLEAELSAKKKERKKQEEAERALLEKGENIPKAGSLKAEISAQLLKGDELIIIDFLELAEFSPELAEELLEQPEDTLKAGEMAFKGFDVQASEYLRIGIKGLPESAKLSLRDIRSNHIGKLIETVVEPESVSDVRPIAVKANFECPSCGNIIPILQNSQKFRTPSGCGCGRKGKFRELNVELRDCAFIGVTQPLGEVLNGRGRRAQMPLIVKGLLATPERMKNLSPGVPLRVTGIPSKIPELLPNGSRTTKYSVNLEASFMETVQDYSFSLDFTREEIKSFGEAVKDKNFLKKFAESCFPNHHGDSHVKESIALQMLSNRFDERQDQESLNVLIIGDPGMGKTRNILRRVEKIAPIARFVQATNSTKAGLLGSANTKDRESGRQVYEPGALPRADKGILMIDEIASLPEEDMKALNEALEEGSITFDKANLHLRVPADICCLAVGNPRDGRFDEYGLTIEKLGIEKSTLDRFDLVFVLVDNPGDETRDRLVVDAMNGKDSRTEEFSPEWLRRFVLYARYAIKPVLRSQEEEALKEAYIKMRKLLLKNKESLLPLSPRRYEGLRALTLISAKAHLRHETTEQDVEHATRLIGAMLSDFHFDKTDLTQWTR